ncbi:unnamed protein product [Effrenium voratum]|nr:unnamed protein product [Effrenium voratum]
MDKRGRGKRMEALEAATEALQIFQDLKDGENEALTQLILTNLHFKLQQPDKAQQAADAALELSTSPLLRGKALHAAALALAARRRFGAAADKAEEARLCFHEAGRLEMEAAELVSVASWRLEALQPLPALSAAEAALRSFRGLSYGKGWPQKALSVLCEALAALGQAPRAVKLTKELRQEFLEAQDLRAVAQLDELQGFLWAQSPRPERAHEPLEAARQTAQTLKEEGWHARICQGQAASFLAGGDATEALQALGRRAREAAKAATDRREEAKSLRQIFQLHFDLRNFEEAIHAAEKARKVAKSSEDTAGEARDCLRMATALANLGRVDAALAKAAEARELADPRGEAQALRTLAELLRMQGDVEKAMEAAEERLTVTRNLGDLSWEAESLQQLAELHLAEGAVEEAALLAEERPASFAKRPGIGRSSYERCLFRWRWHFSKRLRQRPPAASWFGGLPRR